MKPLILLLATAAALPHVIPHSNVRHGPSVAAAAALEAGAGTAAGGAGAAIGVGAASAGIGAVAAATALVVFADDTVRAEVANTAALRSQGLMYREVVPDGTGMLFVFEREAMRSFWMQNTYVALDVAFIDANFRIVDIQQMEARSTEVHDGARPAMFALEVRQGWFAEKGIEVGDRCELIFSG